MSNQPVKLKRTKKCKLTLKVVKSKLCLFKQRKKVCSSTIKISNNQIFVKTLQCRKQEYDLSGEILAILTRILFRITKFTLHARSGWKIYVVEETKTSICKCALMPCFTCAKRFDNLLLIKNLLAREKKRFLSFSFCFAKNECSLKGLTSHSWWKSSTGTNVAHQVLYVKWICC